MFTILWAPLQQVAQFRGTDVIAMSSHMEVPPRAFLGEQRVAAVQVPRKRRKRVGQLTDIREIRHGIRTQRI